MRTRVCGSCGVDASSACLRAGSGSACEVSAVGGGGGGILAVTGVSCVARCWRSGRSELKEDEVGKDARREEGRTEQERSCGAKRRGGGMRAERTGWRARYGRWGIRTRGHADSAQDVVPVCEDGGDGWIGDGALASDCKIDALENRKRESNVGGI